MKEYETKIIGHSGRVRLRDARQYLSEVAAVRAAKKLCGEGDYVEVWRGKVCVYNERPKPLRMIWPVISGRASA
jgi:hypothetical protein